MKGREGRGGGAGWVVVEKLLGSNMQREREEEGEEREGGTTGLIGKFKFFFI